jgi:hypothetical protein
MDDSGVRDRDRHINHESGRIRTGRRAHPGRTSAAGPLRTLVVDGLGHHARRRGVLDQVHASTSTVPGGLVVRMTLLARPVVAIGFGAFLLCAETCLHFESLLSLPQSWLSLPIHDWVAGSFLIYAGARSERD